MLRGCSALALRRFGILSANLKVLRNNRNISDISKIWFTPLPKDSEWIKPCQVNYIQNGVHKTWDIIKLFDGVLIMLYNVSRKKLIYVRQFRPAVYVGGLTGNDIKIPNGVADLCQFPPELGMTLEPCAGLMDKDKSPEQTAKEEVFEECGYDIPVDNLELIYEFRSGVGASSSTQRLFYGEICDDQKVTKGGGVDDEIIQVMEVTVDEARNMLKKGSKINGGPATVIGTLWFLTNKAPNLK